MKHMSYAKKLFFCVLTLAMFFSFVSVVYAGDASSRYSLFEEKQAIVEEINAEFGLEFYITMACPDESYVELLTLDEFRTLLLTFAAHQQEEIKYFEYVEANRASYFDTEYMLFVPFNQERTFHGREMVPVHFPNGPMTHLLEARATITHIPFSSVPPVFRHGYFVPPRGFGINHSPVTVASMGVIDNGRTVRGLFLTQSVSLDIGGFWLHASNVRHTIDFIIVA